MAPRRRLAASVKKGLLAPYNCPAHRLATLRFVQDIPLKPGDPGFDMVDQVEQVTSEEAMEWAHKLMQQEGIVTAAGFVDRLTPRRESRLVEQLVAVCGL